MGSFPRPLSHPLSKGPTPRVPIVRAMEFEFDAGQIPRHWFMGNAHVTALANALQLLFPEGERFFIRALRHYEDRVKDPLLYRRMRAFYGQEGRHGQAHERFFRVLEAQGYEIRSFLEWYKGVAYARIEKLAPPALRLATTAALEHFTALLGRNALSSDFLNFAHPTMAALMKWHAAEEIEHKSVAFDVFEAVDGRYSMRIAGLFVATLVLMWFWRAGTLHLLRQEEKLGTDLRASWEFAKNNPRLRLERKRRIRLFVRGFLEYMHPSFHPDNTNDAPLAENYLASIGRLDG